MKKLVGLFASVALMTSGAALAQGEQQDTSQQGSSSMQQGSSDLGVGSSQDEGVGGSGSMGGSQQGSMGGAGSMGQMKPMTGNQLTGQVLKSEKDKVLLKNADGAIISLKVDKKTQFTDPSVKSAKNLQPGQEIRASFKVEGTDNVATSIEPSTGGMGGSGVMQPDTGINQPSEPSQGGSGMEKNKDLGSGSDISGSQQEGSQKTY